MDSYSSESGVRAPCPRLSNHGSDCDSARTNNTTRGAACVAAPLPASYTMHPHPHESADEGLSSSLARYWKTVIVGRLPGRDNPDAAAEQILLFSVVLCLLLTLSLEAFCSDSLLFNYVMQM